MIGRGRMLSNNARRGSRPIAIGWSAVWAVAGWAATVNGAAGVMFPQEAESNPVMGRLDSEIRATGADRQEPESKGVVTSSDRPPGDLPLPLDLPLCLAEDFEHGSERREPMDPAAWRIEEVEGNAFFHQFQKATAYQPPHRSPVNVALLKEFRVGDFVMDVRVRSPHPDYDHRDVCLLFGYQDAAHYYYAHLGKKMDEHANQLFAVDGAPRARITERTGEGTPWDDAWHSVRVVRRVGDGRIDIFFDDLTTPAMSAVDRRFGAGALGSVRSTTPASGTICGSTLGRPKRAQRPIGEFYSGGLDQTRFARILSRPGGNNRAAEGDKGFRPAGIGVKWGP